MRLLKSKTHFGCYLEFVKWGLIDRKKAIEFTKELLEKNNFLCPIDIMWDLRTEWIHFKEIKDENYSDYFLNWLEAISSNEEKFSRKNFISFDILEINWREAGGINRKQSQQTS